MSELFVKSHRSIFDIGADQWNALIPADAPPFLSWDFMAALEESGCATADTGWAAQHLILYDGDTPLGLMPLYLKSHSQGEYVFDHNWAHAFERAGGHYYPKLQSSIPFTPVTGPRIMAETVEHQKLLAQSAAQLARNNDISSLHLTFIPEKEESLLNEAGFMIRYDQQFHWFNQGYHTFDDFLTALSSRKRKNIRKERITALENHIEVEWLSGTDLKEDHWDHYFQFYLDTSNRKWGQPYLNRAFFSLIHRAMADRIVLMLAKREGRYIAGALNFRDDQALYGRYWGATEHHPCLHFELCYYQAIDYAIQHGLQRIEAGAQGDHKLARGYVPVKTRSAHYICDPGFREAVAHFLDREGQMVDHQIAVLSDHYTPFKKGD